MYIDASERVSHTNPPPHSVSQTPPVHQPNIPLNAHLNHIRNCNYKTVKHTTMIKINDKLSIIKSDSLYLQIGGMLCELKITTLTYTEDKRYLIKIEEKGIILDTVCKILAPYISAMYASKDLLCIELVIPAKD